MMRKNKPRVLFVAILSVFFVALLTAGGIKFSWAETQSTQTTTTTTTTTNNEGNIYKSTSVKTVKSQPVKQPPQKEEGHSVLGSFFGFLGNVIAFPFRMIGSAFKAIF